MVDYGMNTLAALRTATYGSARALGLSEELGTVQVGKFADLIVLDEGADPVANITSLAQVETVIRAGRVVVRDKQVIH
jgi:imidazolonepropionase-like amidohydrolase